MVNHNIAFSLVDNETDIISNIPTWGNDARCSLLDNLMFLLFLYNVKIFSIFCKDLLQIPSLANLQNKYTSTSSESNNRETRRQ